MTAMLLARQAETGSRASWLILAGTVLAVLLTAAGLLVARRIGWLPRPVPEMADLSREEQRLVLRAVGRGEAVADPALAPAAAAAAKRMRLRLDFVAGRGWTTVMWSLAGLFTLITVVDIATGNRD